MLGLFLIFIKEEAEMERKFDPFDLHFRNRGITSTGNSSVREGRWVLGMNRKVGNC